MLVDPLNKNINGFKMKTFTDKIFYKSHWFKKKKKKKKKKDFFINLLNNT